MNDFNLYVEACNYPGKLDETEAQKCLEEYCATLKIKRKVRRIAPDWSVWDYPDILNNVNEILDKISPGRAARAARAARDAIAARTAIDARDARAAIAARDAIAIQSFANWMIQSAWYWWSWELSWYSTTYLGAIEEKKEEVVKWSKPLFRAFLAGAWFLYWTPETLYWVAKPKIHTQNHPLGERRRLHNEIGPAVESDVENLYFYEGVLVPAFVIVRPDWITWDMIAKEKNAEVRRVMMKRFGWERVLTEVKPKLLDSHPDPAIGELYEFELDGQKYHVAKVQNGTPIGRDKKGGWLYETYFLNTRTSLNDIVSSLKDTYPLYRNLTNDQYLSIPRT